MTADAREKLTAALDDLLPRSADLTRITDLVDRIAGKRAAEELRAAADEVRDNHGTASLSAKRIDARAAALDAKPEPEPVPDG